MIDVERRTADAEHETLHSSTRQFIDEFVNHQSILGELDAAFELCGAPDPSRNEQTSPRRRSISPVRANDDSRLPAVSTETNLFNSAWRWFARFDMSRVCLLFLVVTILQTIFHHALFGQGRLATLKPSDPVPFFNDHSTNDYFTGNGADIDTLLRNAEVSILMYYAPWSLHSMEMRDVYSRVGDRFRRWKGVRFSAVNCAANGGQCKKSYKLYSYPIIVAHIGKLSILYQDTANEENLFRWVNHVLHPAIRIQSYNQFEDTVFEYDRCVVGYFNFKDLKAGDVPPGYITFIASAMTLGQHGEQIENIQFAVVTNETIASELGMNRSGTIRVFRISDGIRFHEYKPTADHKPQIVVSWAISSQFETPDPVNWINFAELELGGKSAKLNKLLSKGTTVLLMTSPRSRLFPGSSFSMFKQVAVEALDCSNETDLVTRQAQYWKNRTANIPEDLRRMKNMCERSKIDRSEIQHCCANVLAEMPKFCKFDLCDDEGTCEEEIPTDDDALMCPLLANTTNYDDLFYYCCHNGRPRRLPESIPWDLSMTEKLHCESVEILKWSPSEVVVDEADAATDRCSANRTLRFVAMDRSNHLYKKLGLRKNEDALLIVDHKQESFFVMRESFQSAAQLRQFINLYDRNLLEPVVLNEKISQSAFSIRKADRKSSSRLERLTSVGDIERKVLARNVTYDSLVYFSGGSWHGPSTAVTHLIHALKHYFSAFDSLIKIFVIDSSRNTLPYELRFERLPAIVFFPSRRSAQSMRFPSGLPLTLPNMLSFVLSRCQSELRWRIALSACSTKCLLQSPQRLRRQISILKMEISLLRRLITTPKENREALSRLVHTLTKRRTIQIRSARHLERLLLTIRSSKEFIPEETDRFIKQTLFTQWVLYNAFGLNYNFDRD